MNDKEFLSLNEAATRFNIPIPTLRSAVQTGNINAHKIGNQWVVKPQDVEKFCDNRPRRGRPKKDR